MHTHTLTAYMLLCCVDSLTVVCMCVCVCVCMYVCVFVVSKYWRLVIEQHALGSCAVNTLVWTLHNNGYLIVKEVQIAINNQLVNVSPVTCSYTLRIIC